MHGIIFEHQKKIDKYYADFTIGNLIIEIDGKYWHSLEKDKIRDEVLKSYGYEIIHILATDRIEEKLRNFSR